MTIIDFPTPDERRLRYWARRVEPLPDEDTGAMTSIEALCSLSNFTLPTTLSDMMASEPVVPFNAVGLAPGGSHACNRTSKQCSENCIVPACMR